MRQTVERAHRPTLRTAAALLAAALIAAACNAAPAVGTPTAPASPTPLASRPSSPAVLQIVRPKSAASLTGTSVHVVLSLQGARIVSATTQNIRPDEGHLHLYVDNVLVSMNYGLEQDIAVQPGTYVLKAEFVAADHAPFNPRVWSPEVFFTVR
jgi:hypothetical protein